MNSFFAIVEVILTKSDNTNTPIGIMLYISGGYYRLPFFIWWSSTILPVQEPDASGVLYFL